VIIREILEVTSGILVTVSAVLVSWFAVIGLIIGFSFFSEKKRLFETCFGFVQYCIVSQTKILSVCLLSSKPKGSVEFWAKDNPTRLYWVKKIVVNINK
jgi:hypothetical protein